MPIVMPPVIDDDGSGTTGTILNNAFFTALGNAINAAIAGETVAFNASTGIVHNVAVVGMQGHTLCLWSGAAPVQWTGLAGGVTGQRFTFRNNSAAQIATFVHASAGSLAANRFANMAASAPVPIAPGGFITYQYDGGTWICLQHEQGSWITPPYAAANFGAVGAMTWTVDAADVGTLRYRLSGKTLQVEFLLSNTSIGGTANNTLHLFNTGWGGFSAAGALVGNRMANAIDNGVLVGTVLARVNGATVIQILKGDLVNWALSTNNTAVEGQLTFDVT